MSTKNRVENGSNFFLKAKVNEAYEIITKDKVECKGKRKEDDEKFQNITKVFKHDEGNILMRNEEKIHQGM